MVIVRIHRILKLSLIGAVAIFLTVFYYKGTISQISNQNLVILYTRTGPHVTEKHEETFEIVGEPATTTETTDIDERMPGAYLRYAEPVQHAEKSYCKFNYGLPHDLIFSKRTETPPETGKNSPYRILYNVTEAWVTENVPRVTYAGHVTANFAYYIPELLRHWDGFLSISAFVPDLDVALFLEQINQYCYCLPDMSRVSIHLVYDKKISLSQKDVYFTPPKHCVIRDSSEIRIYKDFDELVTYPVNVCRNAARMASLTKHVMVSDVELMPSENLAREFIHMLEKYRKTGTDREVFVVPIFEVEETEKIPRTKQELIKLIEEKKAVYFHGMVCKHCQRFPGMRKWLNITDAGTEVKPFLTAKRAVPFERWEPIFIGTNAEPYYSENLTWEGLQDKMAHSLEMCLMNYNFTILDGAFLVHWPGIKKIKVTREEWRTSYVEQNKKEYAAILRKFRKNYKTNPRCFNANAKIKLPIAIKDRKVLSSSYDKQQ